MAKIIDNGWTTLQEANPEKHVLEISVRAEDGMVVEVRIRHSHGEEVQSKVMFQGAPALPMAINDFQKNFSKGLLEIR